MSDTVLIARSEKLSTLLARHELRGAATFPDTDVPGALGAILRERPAVVALDREFAETSRGLALIDRIKSDPALRTCDVRIVSGEFEGDRPATDAAPSGQEVVLDEHGTRRTEHTAMRENLAITLDGNPAVLLDLSVSGAQVLTSMTLRPNQHVRLALPDGPRPIRLRASVLWASFEMPKEGPRFRAGLRFPDPDAQSLTRFIDANRADGG